MKLSSGKRIGQSRQELRAAAYFSFILHAIFFFAIVLLHIAIIPKKRIPPSYEVSLVAQQSEAGLAPKPQKPPEQKKDEPPKPKLKPGSRKQIKTTKKGDMPNLKREKPPEQRKPERAAEPTPPPQKAEGASVAVKTPSDFERPELSYYSELVRRKIADNWKHLPVSGDVKVKVVFTILRSGWVDDVRLEEASGVFQFDQAAVRAIRSASPFPPLPEGFYRSYAVFSADLTPE